MSAVPAGGPGGPVYADGSPVYADGSPIGLDEEEFDRGEFATRSKVIHGYKRAYRMAGSGPALLMIHGIGDSSATWRTVMPDLARDHTVIAPDLLGHGASDKPRGDYSVAGYANAMRDLLTVLDIDQVTVIGHSLGGGVAAQFAYEYPDRFERLVLVSTGGVSRTVSPLLRLAAAPGVDLLMPVLSASPMRTGGRIVGEVLRFFGAGLGIDIEEILRVFGSLPDSESRQAIVRTLRASIDWHGQVITMLDRAYLVQDVPTLLIWGAKDAIIPVQHGTEAHHAMPGSRLEIFEDAAHFPHHTDPARFLRVLREFLTTTAPVEYTPEKWRDLLRAGRPEPEAAAI
ncbi:MAG: alpha/beta fold hydrolase [Acidimicrobiales bacterium]